MASVLITGTSAGIGLSTALTVARAGHTVYATMRNPANSTELAELAARERLPIHISTMDVDSDDSVKSGIEAIYKNAKHIDVLVNNAGLEASGSVEELPLAKMRAVMETNYFGVLRCIQAVIPDMRQRKSGCIINISSISGTGGKFALRLLRGVEVCTGGNQRGAGPGDVYVQRESRDCRARDYRHGNGAEN